MKNDRIAESEATSYAGVSAATLKRFADAGYLRVDQDSDGQKFYSLSEFESVFGGVVPTRPESSSLSDEIVIETENLDIDEKKILLSEDKIIDQKDETHQKILLLEKDVVRLNSLVHLQEKLIEAGEREVERMIEERNWLRERVEKLEEKSNRDQLILVSVTETNRGLVSAIERRKSPIKAALDWLGITGDEQQTSQAQQH